MKTLNQYEHSIDIIGSQDSKTIRTQQRRRRPHSRFETTGLYANAGDTITFFLESQNAVSISGIIGVRYLNQNEQEFTLSPGVVTEITAQESGMIYFSDLVTGNVSRVHINGAKQAVCFDIDKDYNSKWEAKLSANPNALFVEFKGRKSLATVSRASYDQVATRATPLAFLTYLDKMVGYQDEASGLFDDVTGVAQSDSHYVHYVEAPYYTGNGYMVATNHVIGIPPGKAVTELLSASGRSSLWGLWHEAGHQMQLEPMTFDDMVEVTVNIYSLYTEMRLGREPRVRNEYATIFQNHFSKSDSKRNFHTLGVFQKLTMLWQLHLAFGEAFFPRLHHAYRLQSPAVMSLTSEQKVQLLILTCSAVSQRNLSSFFHQWGLYADADTQQALSAYADLQQPIWLNTDDDVIQEHTLPAIVSMPCARINASALTADVGDSLEEFNDSILASVVDYSNRDNSSTLHSKSLAWLDGVQVPGTGQLGILLTDSQGNENLYPVDVAVEYYDALRFLNSDRYVTNNIVLKHKTKTFYSYSATHLANKGVESEYFGVALYNNSNEKLFDVSVKGTDKFQLVSEQLNGFEFDYGYQLEIRLEKPTYMARYCNGVMRTIGTGNIKTFIITEQGMLLQKEING
ncbi:M60 family metallopeptidase [Serratia quinivorans]|uniref:M60 family metallopeptidase n=1 Tax=Serratia quinivorans TaxID=137545 RepID=UPI001C48C9F5|nr:M60 family metallopeptidase [Serratia quinivorans]MBV6694016.1 M60 family metallopeptidase [Serratia quinivorans]